MKTLSGVLAFVFFVGSLLPKSDWEELPKLANLIEHYNEHKAIEPASFTFLDYICNHYIIPVEDRDATHHQLPFFHHCFLVFHALLPVFEFNISVHESHPILVTRIPEFQPREHSGSIFQPPKA